MTLIYQTPAQANIIIDALTSSAGPGTTEYRASVAYVTREGAKKLVDALAARVGAAWGTIPKSIVTCFDWGTTEPAALEYLQAQGFAVRIANLGADGAIRIKPDPASFHPKVYLASEGTAVQAVIGSANLSRRALSVNTEAVTAIELTSEDAASLWESIVANSVELTEDLLQSYKDKRPAQKATPTPDEPPVPAPAPIGTARVLGDAVEDQSIDPAEFQAFWLEAGSMSSSWSHHQLETPRHANRFFGFGFDEHDNEQRQIGDVSLIVGGVQYPEQRLVWHGDNRMERLYLPTPAQTGIDYANKVVLFQRAGTSFTVSVEDPTSERATQWRDESAASGTLFRAGQNSPRWCGLL